MRYGNLTHRLGSMKGFEASVSGNCVTLLHDGRQCLPAMLDAVAAAEREILLEMYWFASDRIGRRFAEALMDKARDGVGVYVIYDAVGSMEADDAMFTEMRAAGCHVHEFNPIAPWRRRFSIAVVNNRDHRKMLIVDGAAGFTGGVNIGDPWMAEEEGGENWRDDMVRIDGPAVHQMRRIFLETWHALEGDGPTAPLDECAPGDSEVRVLANHYFGERRAIRRAYLTMIRRARHRIFITNSYFVPDRIIRRALTGAVRRGVEVRVLLPGEGDVPAAFYAGRRLYDLLLRRGIHIHEYQGNVLHAKTAVVDGSWCTVGTYNLDYRSWRFNLEVTAFIHDRKVAGAMERRFREDITRATELALVDWRYRSIGDRLAENFYYLFRKLL